MFFLGLILIKVCSFRKVFRFHTIVIKCNNIINCHFPDSILSPYHHILSLPLPMSLSLPATKTMCVLKESSDFFFTKSAADKQSGNVASLQSAA